MVLDLNLLPLVPAAAPSMRNTYILLPGERLVVDGPLVRTGDSFGDATSGGFVTALQLKRYYNMMG